MRCVMLVSDDCGACGKAKQLFKKWLDSGEIELASVESDDKTVSELVFKALVLNDGIAEVPMVLFVDKQGDIFTLFSVDEIAGAESKKGGGNSK